MVWLHYITKNSLIGCIIAGQLSVFRDQLLLNKTSPTKAPVNKFGTVTNATSASPVTQDNTYQEFFIKDIYT